MNDQCDGECCMYIVHGMRTRLRLHLCTKFMRSNFRRILNGSEMTTYRFVVVLHSLVRLANYWPFIFDVVRFGRQKTTIRAMTK